MEVPGDILITTSTCPLSAGDPQPRFVLDLAASLVPHFNHVHLLAPGAPGAAAREDLNGVLVHRFQYAWPAAFQQLCYRHGIMQNIRANPLLLSLLPSLVGAQVVAIRRLCREFPVRIVNSHWFLFQSLAAAVACKGMGIRHVPHSHGADVYLLERFGGLGRAVARYVARRSDGIICESTYVRERLDGLLGYPSGAAVSCMGVDGRRFAAAQSAERMAQSAESEEERDRRAEVPPSLRSYGGTSHGSRLEEKRLNVNSETLTDTERIQNTRVRMKNEENSFNPKTSALSAKSADNSSSSLQSEIGNLNSEISPPSSNSELKTHNSQLSSSSPKSKICNLNSEISSASSPNSEISNLKSEISSSLLFVGRLVEKKGVEYLIRALPRVLEVVPEARLRIAGGGALESELRALAEKMGLMGAGVEFLGPLPQARIAELLSETRVVALPSIVDSHGEADGMPTVLLEAMAAGCLVVASRVNGIPDVLKHGENGWLAEPRDVADLAAKLLEALAYSETRIPAEALKTAQQYDWSVLGARYAEELKRF